jgi:ATP-dependent DNA helicase UvrD/PcrA
MLAHLPTLSGDLHTWVRTAATVVGASSTTLADPPAKKSGQVIRAERKYQDIAAADAFLPSHGHLRAQTVHELKGESRDAVLVVAGPAGVRRHTPQARLWSMPLVGDPIPDEEAEELRIAFVALTRAARFCAVALPADSDPQTVQAFLDNGFVRSPA